MSRPDVMALSPDDPAVLTNRGTVKRALRELEAGEGTGAVEKSADGEVTARWSDGVECRLPPDKVIGEGRCTCAATELCRHLVRTVLADRRLAEDAAAVVDEAGAPAAPSEPWNPGQITDDALTAPGELVLLGLQRADAHTARSWRELARFGMAIGFNRLSRPVAMLADALELKSDSPRWDMRPAARIALELTALARLALDVSH